jgi:hypothetical protein
MYFFEFNGFFCFDCPKTGLNFPLRKQVFQNLKGNGRQINHRPQQTECSCVRPATGVPPTGYNDWWNDIAMVPDQDLFLLIEGAYQAANEQIPSVHQNEEQDFERKGD